MRLALKAQSQCRTTAETLAVMRNPPVFARQANVVNGPQQVNVTSATNQASRAEIPEIKHPELLEAHGERVDGGAALKAGRGPSGAGARGGTRQGRERPRARRDRRGTATAAGSAKECVN
jgi:hypothetical protein